MVMYSIIVDDGVRMKQEAAPANERRRKVIMAIHVTLRLDRP